MLEKLLNYRQIEGLTSQVRSAFLSKSDKDRRAQVPIAVIDDESFKPEQNLRALGYDIHVIGDLKSISEVASYNIVLCDLQGVGHYLNRKKQGAFIIDELKRNHPEKFVIAYTGGSMDDSVTLAAQQVADVFIRKDAEIEEWRDKLDSIVNLLSDPVQVWRRQRWSLVEANVPTLQILKLEDAFVRAIQSRDENIYSNLLHSQNISADVRAVAQSMIASGLFKLLVG